MKSWIASSIVAAIGLACGAPASAQTQPAPAEQGGPTSGRPVTSFLDLGADVFGAADRSLGSGDTALSGSRSFWGANSTLTYERATRSLIFGADGAASYRRFSEISDLAPSYSGGLRLSGRPSRRTRFDLSQNLSYGPTNALSLLGVGELSVGSQLVPSIDYRLLQSNQLATSTRAMLSYNVSRRGTLSGSVNFDYAETPETPAPVDPQVPEAPGPDPAPGTTQGSFKRLDLAARYTNAFSRYMSWYAGYATTDNIGSVGVLTVARTHTIDLGVSYSRPLAFSRRTTVSGQIGSQVVQAPNSGGREWRAAGSAGIQHEIGRTWRAQALFLRDTRFVPLFAQPALSDAISTSLTGNVTRQSTLGIVANYSRGSVGVATGNNGFRGTSTSVSYRYAVLRALGVYAEYFLFDFDFDSGVELAQVLSSDSRRHGIRFGVTFGTGLWGNRRRTPLTFTGEGQQ